MARFAFIQNLTFEYLGPMCISALLKKHDHDVRAFIVSDDEDKVLKELVAFRPDLIGFPATTGMHRWALGFARKIKEAGLPGKVVFGGPHATYFPEVIKEPQVDIICRGEGEHAVLELADKIDAGQDFTDTLSCWFKLDGRIIENEQRRLVEDLDELPFPDRELYISKYPHLKRSQKAFMGGRGCPFDCTFCFNHAFVKLYKGKGRILRHRSVDNLLAEIKEVRDRYGLKTVYMQDDTLVLNKKWIMEFAEKYKNEIGLPFVCLIRADLVDEEMAKKLKDAGCKNAFFGIETGSEDLRNLLLKKKITDEEVRNTARLLKKYRIRFRTYNMLGLPGETLEDAFKTVRLNAEIRTDYPWCALFHPFPGTELAEYARGLGLLDASEDAAAPSFFKDSILKSDYKMELVNLQKLFFYGVKFPSLIPLIKRLIKFNPNIVFEIAFLAGYAWCYLGSENITLTEMFSVGIRNVRKFFFSKEGGND